MAITHETELYLPIKAYYEQRGYEVKAEVVHCDLIAIHPESGDMVIVEMKRTFNLALLLQGVERLRLGDNVVLAVERNRKKTGAHNQRFGDLTELCRMLGLGLMTVVFYKTKAPMIEMLCEPGELPRRGRRHTRQSKLLTEFKERSGDYNTGGSSKRKLVTAYREKALRCAWALQMLGQAAPRQIAALSGNAKAAKFLQQDYYGWFLRIERGVYTLRPEGSAALEQYADIVANWNSAPPAVRTN